MSDKRAPRRSLDDWMELVTECRQSGLTDAAWCEAQGISPSCFYNAVSRLRKRACQIPDPIGKASTLNLTSHKQDVVQIAIEPELSPAELFQDERSSSMYLDNSHTIEIEAKEQDSPVFNKFILDEYSIFILLIQFHLHLISFHQRFPHHLHDIFFQNIQKSTRLLPDAL